MHHISTYAVFSIKLPNLASVGSLLVIELVKEIAIILGRQKCDVGKDVLSMRLRTSNQPIVNEGALNDNHVLVHNQSS